MRIALDAMGGDYAPKVTVEGAVMAAREYGVEIILVGPEEILAAELKKYETGGLTISIEHAPTVITMEEHPAAAVKKKKDSSISVSARLVADGRAQGFVSAGNSGAVLVVGQFIVKRIPGIARPAFATLFPTEGGNALLLDTGATTDCKASFLLQFAQMGSIYMQKVQGIARPRVGLISNGEEEAKGNILVQETFPLLKAATELNFIGNLEVKDLLKGACDVAVTDGFTGNMILKTGEGVAEMMMRQLRKDLTATLWRKLLAMALRPAFQGVRKRLDYREYGGVPLLGVDGVAIVAHGRSDALAIKNAIRVAKRQIEQGTVEAIRLLATRHKEDEVTGEITPSPASPAE